MLIPHSGKNTSLCVAPVYGRQRAVQRFEWHYKDKLTAFMNFNLVPLNLQEHCEDETISQNDHKANPQHVRHFSIQHHTQTAKANGIYDLCKNNQRLQFAVSKKSLAHTTSKDASTRCKIQRPYCSLQFSTLQHRC